MAVVLAIAGVFGTWRNAGPVSLDGVEGPHNGWLVVIFALIALVGIGPLSRGSWLGGITVLGCGAVMASTAIEALVDDSDVLGGSSGWGVWLTLAMSLALCGAAVAGVALPRLRAGSTPSRPGTGDSVAT